MLVAIKGLCKRSFLEQFANIWSYLGQVIAIFGTLFVYWFTSKAFAPTLGSGIEGSKVSYFNYLLVGDLTFMLPALLFAGLSGLVRKGVSEGSFELMMTSCWSPVKGVIVLALSHLPVEALKAIVIFSVAAFWLGLQVPELSLLGVLLFQILALPGFLGLGLLSVAFMVFTGRGDAVVSYLSSALVVISGAYFPLAVLPKGLRFVGATLSPHQALLEGTRKVLIEGLAPELLGHYLLVFLLWSVFLFPLGYLCLRMSFRYARRTGHPLLY